MRSRTMLAICLAALTCLLAAPGTPASGASGDLPESTATAAFEVQGTNGYRLLVVAGHTDGKSWVLIFAHRNGSEVVYDAPATVVDTQLSTPGASPTIATSIRADLGSLGRISLDFNPAGTTEAVQPRCRALPLTIAGTYSGSFEFAGEEGYTHASTAQVPFSPQRFADLGCAVTISEESVGTHLPGAELVLNSTAQGRHVRLQVNKNGPAAPTAFSATLHERRGAVSIERTVEGGMPPSAFSFDPRLQRASLSLASPFSGRTSFVRSSGADRIAGRLQVDFPGRAKVLLTGPHAHLSLFHARLRTPGPSGSQ